MLGAQVPGGRCQSVANMEKFNKLPKRWTDYIPVGKRVAGTRFIAFKVPLKSVFDGKLSPEQRFSPVDLIGNIKEQKEELGLIIDLTCTTRYYDPEELPKTLHYSKIFTAGQVIPDPKTIQQFKSIVTMFLKENADNDKLIGVHCTHGLNRTGYLVCRYLIDVEGMAPNLAIELFNRSRGHSIERQNYILDLQGKPPPNYHVQKHAGATVNRGQAHVMNGYPPNGAGPGWHHQHHSQRFAPAWQYCGSPRFPSTWQNYRPQRLPPPHMYFCGQCDYGDPPYRPQNGSWHDQSWRRPPQWNQNAQAPRHIRFPDESGPPLDPYFLPVPTSPSPAKQPPEVPEWRRRQRQNSGERSNPHKPKETQVDMRLVAR